MTVGCATVVLLHPARQTRSNSSSGATALGDSVAPDGRNWRTQEYMGHWGLDAISAAEAYTRGHFGQGVTIAVADDGMDSTHPDLAGRIVAQRHVVNGNATA